MRRSGTIWFFALAFIIPVAAYAIFNFYERKIQKLPVLGPAGHHIGNFSLVNQEDEVVSLEKWNNKIVVADFFFTHCPTICPKMTANLKRVNEYFIDDKDIYLNSFSVDPVNDSAAQLRKYAHHFNVNTRQWDLLTGDKKEIYKLARNSFMIVATDGDGGPGDFIHSDRLILIDKQKRIRGYYDGTDDSEINQLLTDIKKLKNEN